MGLLKKTLNIQWGLSRQWQAGSYRWEWEVVYIVYTVYFFRSSLSHQPEIFYFIFIFLRAEITVWECVSLYTLCAFVCLRAWVSVNVCERETVDSVWMCSTDWYYCSLLLGTAAATSWVLHTVRLHKASFCSDLFLLFFVSHTFFCGDICLKLYVTTEFSKFTVLRLLHQLVVVYCFAWTVGLPYFYFVFLERDIRMNLDSIIN